MRERLVLAAEQVIREKGLARTTTKEISEAAKCSEGALYRHFASKEELFLAVLAERLPSLLPMLQDLASAAGRGTVRATLTRLVTSAVAFYDQSVPMTASVFAEPSLLRQHGDAMRKANMGPQRGVEHLSAYLRAEQRLGRITRAANPDAAAQMLLGACYQRALLDHLAPPARQPSQRTFARHLVDTLLAGLAPD